MSDIHPTSNNKAVTKTVSMPEKIWEAIDTYAPTINEDRSSWLRGLAVKALADAGKLPDSPKAKIISTVDALFEAIGPDALNAELEAITARSLSVTT